jgi:peptidoglycan biosynthesis protein MviN/MurJ (putative lipid II flippase)
MVITALCGAVLQRRKLFFVAEHAPTIAAVTLQQRACLMIESGFWIFLVEGAVAGALFIALIWWVVGGTKQRDQERLRNATRIQSEGEISAPTRNDARDKQ